MMNHVIIFLVITAFAARYWIDSNILGQLPMYETTQHMHGQQKAKSPHFILKFQIEFYLKSEWLLNIRIIPLMFASALSLI